MNQIPVSRVTLYGLLMVVTAAVDLISKDVVFRRFSIHSGGDWLLDGWFKLRLFTSLNQGALWGVGQGFALGFAALSVSALVGIWYWLFWREGCQSVWLTTALALVSGGTLGNLYDRLGIHGLKDPHGQSLLAVRDFLDVRLGNFEWAIFNVADICLVTGAIMLMAKSLTMPQESPLATAE
jgi:signal peptidase II